MVLTCKNCGIEFRSAIQMPEETFATAVLRDNSEQCPRCRKSSTYSKPDYRFTTVRSGD
jgi:predicted nucleic-acid-binding Zn-ribbon protein